MGARRSRFEPPELIRIRRSETTQRRSQATNRSRAKRLRERSRPGTPCTRPVRFQRRRRTHVQPPSSDVSPWPQADPANPHARRTRGSACEWIGLTRTTDSCQPKINAVKDLQSKARGSLSRRKRARLEGRARSIDSVRLRPTPSRSTADF